VSRRRRQQAVFVARHLRVGAAALLVAALLGGCARRPEPLRYDCRRTTGPIVVDGRLDEPTWDDAPWTEPFGHITGDLERQPRYETRVRMLWDDDRLYVGAVMEEPHVWATMTERDEIVFLENDFEVFLDPDDDGAWYVEVEINALGTIFDLLLSQAYMIGGEADHDWNVQGLESAVDVDGTPNDPRDVDVGWSVELAIPFAIFAEHSDVALPPRPGDVWRVNLARVQWPLDVEESGYVKTPDAREENWSWSPQHHVNMHLPWYWGYVEFVEGDGGLLRPTE
jgi:hypothetical protein